MTPYEKNFKVPGRFEEHECTFITWPCSSSDLEIDKSLEFDCSNEKEPLSAIIYVFLTLFARRKMLNSITNSNITTFQQLLKKLLLRRFNIDITDKMMYTLTYLLQQF